MAYRDPDIRRGKGLANTPLLLACCEGSVIAVKLLLDLGAKVDWRVDQGYNGLHHCQDAKEGGGNVATLLLEHKPPDKWREALRVDERNNYGRAAIHMAAKSGRRDMVNLLLRHAENPNALSEKEKWTPLLVVLNEMRDDRTQPKYNAVINILLTYKVDLTIGGKVQRREV
jgi:ankyrin repeat protein